MAKKDKKSKPAAKLSERVNLRVTDKEYALLEEASSRDDRSLSNWARGVLVREARRQLGKKS